MTDLAGDLATLATELEKRAVAFDQFEPDLDRVFQSASRAGNAWSGSWAGYHSRVYYSGLETPPPGANFSVEWGLGSGGSFDYTRGDWSEYQADDIVAAIMTAAGNPDLSQSQHEAQEIRDTFDRARHEILSVVETALARGTDEFLARVRDDVVKAKVLTATDYVTARRPSQMASRDTLAMGQGLQVPPHISLEAKIYAIRAPAQASRKLAEIARRAARHMERQMKTRPAGSAAGTRIFIGHGRSLVWKDLKDFLQDRLHLPWDEFNRVPIAGITNIARLSQLLDSAAFAFLVMTGEDETVDGEAVARLNVIHEAGLFQGRLGFTRAIVLLEEGCKQFSNIEGLGQIRFPKGNIQAAFEQIREVLEREGLLAS